MRTLAHSHGGACVVGKHLQLFTLMFPVLYAAPPNFTLAICKASASRGLEGTLSVSPAPLGAPLPSQSACRHTGRSDLSSCLSRDAMVCPLHFAQALQRHSIERASLVLGCPEAVSSTPSANPDTSIVVHGVATRTAWQPSLGAGVATRSCATQQPVRGHTFCIKPVRECRPECRLASPCRSTRAPGSSRAAFDLPQTDPAQSGINLAGHTYMQQQE